MRIDELKRIAKENDYEHWELEYLHVFTKKHTNYFICISKNKEKRIWVKTPMMCDDKDFYMTKAAVKFAEIPPEDREEEKKFYLRHKWMSPRRDHKAYLNHWIESSEYWLDEKNETENVQTQFTREEIEEIKKKFDTDLKDFKEDEVKE